MEKEKQLSMALALIPLFFVALFLRLEGFFPALFEPVLWRMQPVGTVLSIVLQYYATAVLLCADGADARGLCGALEMGVPSAWGGGRWTAALSGDVRPADAPAVHGAAVPQSENHLCNLS